MKALLVQLGRLMSLRMLAIGLTFLQTIALTRVFGGEVFGLLSVGLSISALLVLILSFGLDQVAMRDIAMQGVSRIAATRQWAILWASVRRVVAPVTLAVVALGIGLLTLTSLGGPYQITLSGAVLLLPLLLARKYLESLCLGAKQVARSIIGSQIAYPLLMVLGAVWVWRMGVESSATSITATYMAAGIGSFLVALLLARPTLVLLRRSPDVILSEEAAPSSRAMLSSGGHFALVSLGFVLGQHIDVLMTGALSGPEDAALVRIASRVAEMAGLMRAIILLQYKPLLAEAHGNQDQSALLHRTRTMTLLFAATGIPITLGLWLFASQVMGVFGPEFVPGGPVMRVYLIGVLFVLLCGPCNSVLAMCGQEHLASRIVWIAIAINFFADLILIPKYGALGCAWANALSMVFLGTASAMTAFRLLGVNTTLLIFSHRNRHKA